MHRWQFTVLLLLSTLALAAVRASANFSNGQTQKDSFVVDVLPRPATPQVGGNVALFDPKGETAKLLDGMGQDERVYPGGYIPAQPRGVFLKKPKRRRLSYLGPRRSTA